MDPYVTSAEFHQKVGVPFLNVLLREEEAVFDMEIIKPVKALLAFDPSEIPTADDTGFVMHGSEKIKILFSFYSKETQTLSPHRPLQSPKVWNMVVIKTMLTHRNKARL